MKIVIFGAAGFVGSSLIHKLCEDRQHDIVAVDDLSYGYLERLNNLPKSVTIKTVSVEDFCRTKLKGVDIVINCAAVAPLPENQIDHHNALSRNVAICGSLINFCLINGVRKILHFSSSAVYENTDPNNHISSTPVLPNLVYPVTKYLSEKYFESQAEVYGLNIVCLRLYNLYGPRQDYFRKQPPLIGYLLRSLLKGEMITVYASRHARRDYIHIDDLVRFIEQFINSPFKVGFDTPDVGSGSNYSVYEIIDIIGKVAGKELKYKVGDAKHFWESYEMMFSAEIPLPREIVEKEVNKISISNIEQTKKQYNWEPRVTMEEGLLGCFDYARSVV